MNSFIIPVLLVALGQAKPEPELAHRRNQIYAALLDSTCKIGEFKANLPTPTLRDGLSETEQQAAILEIAGSEVSRKELLRDSVTAPFILKVQDTPGEEAILRRIDLWFVIRGDLGKLDPLRLAGESSGQAVDVGNMKFESRILTAEELARKNLSSLTRRDLSNWYVCVKGRLLGRTGLKAVDEVMASRTSESMVVASRTSSAFDSPGDLTNRWWSIDAGREAGPEHPFAGGLCYAKVSRLETSTDKLWVELHCVFSEPRGWFQGEPILRSKFGLVAQDQIRRLRREFSANRSKPTP